MNHDIVNFIYDIFYPAVHTIRLALFRYKWRTKNSHNETAAVSRFPISKVEVGNKTYGPLKVISFGNEEEGLIIGNFCSIAANTTFLLSGEHNYKLFTNYPISRKIFGKNGSTCKGKIVVEDDVWIGYGSIILSGITLGKGCIIGAGSVVRRDVPPYAIQIGGEIIKYRFSDDIKSLIKKEVDFSMITDEIIINNHAVCNESITVNNVQKIIASLKIRKEHE